MPGARRGTRRRCSSVSRWRCSSALALMSLRGGWELLGIDGWVWLILCIPEAVLLVAFYDVAAGRRVAARRGAGWSG